MGAWPKFHRSAFKFKRLKYFLPFTASSSWRGNNIEFCKDRTIGIMIILKRTIFFKKLFVLFLWIGFKDLKENHYKDTKLLTFKLPEVLGIHLTGLKRMKG